MKSISKHMVEEIQMDNESLRKCLLLILIREMQIHKQVPLYIHSPGLAKLTYNPVQIHFRLLAFRSIK